MRRAIRKHLRDFVAVVALCAIALGVGGYILAKQRFSLPAWVPVVGADVFTLRGEFENAKSITPGQGQTVTIAGVNVGEISRVDLVEGRAVVEMRIRREDADVYRNASMLLRPRTGLEDMVVSLDPGTPDAGRLDDGATVRIQNTLPTVQFDQILAQLDADTRDFLRLLLAGAGQGLGGQERHLAATLKRFEPGARDLRRITERLAERRRHISRSMHNFRLLAEALGDKDDQLAQFVDASNAVFRSFAQEERSLREALDRLPRTLRATRTGLAKTDRMARQLGPALEDLRPFARNLEGAQRDLRPFLRETTPVVRDQLRPFAREVRPVVRSLRPAARDLASVAPDLATTLTVVNDLVDVLAYNPPGKQEGYLFWAGWASHIGATLFGNSDAHGPIRRGVVMTSCPSLAVLDTIKVGNPVLGTLTTLLDAPKRTEVCQTPAQARAQRSEGGR